jgi:SAM domain (Sterile alpha motif)
MEPRHQPAKAPLEIKLTASSSAHEVQQWLCERGLERLGRHFQDYSGAVLLNLTQEQMERVCGASDGILLHTLTRLSAEMRPEELAMRCVVSMEDGPTPRDGTPVQYPGLFQCLESPWACAASVFCFPCFGGWMGAREGLDNMRAFRIGSTKHSCACCWLVWCTALFTALPCVSWVAPRTFMTDDSHNAIYEHHYHYRNYPRDRSGKALCIGVFCPCCSLVQVKSMMDALDAQEGYQTESYWEFCCNRRWACLS